MLNKSLQANSLIGNALIVWLYRHHRNTRSLHNDIKNNLKRGQAATQNK